MQTGCELRSRGRTYFHTPGDHTCCSPGWSFLGGLLWFLMWAAKMLIWSKWTARYFPVKVGLFEINREWQFSGCHCIKLCESPCTVREGQYFYRGEKEVGRAIGNKESLAFHWLSLCQGRRGGCLPIGLCYGCSAREFSPSGLQILFSYIFYKFIYST